MLLRSSSVAMLFKRSVRPLLLVRESLKEPFSLLGEGKLRPLLLGDRFLLLAFGLGVVSFELVSKKKLAC